MPRGAQGVAGSCRRSCVPDRVVDHVDAAPAGGRRDRGLEVLARVEDRPRRRPPRARARPSPSVETVPSTRAPRACASWTSSRPTPPAAAWTRQVSPAFRGRCRAPGSARSCPAASRPRRRSSRAPSGTGTARSAGTSACSAYEPSTPAQATRSPSRDAGHALADRLDDARALAAGRERQRRRVEARAVVDVDEVDARSRATRTQHLARPGRRRRHVLEPQHLGPARLVDADGLHGTDTTRVRARGRARDARASRDGRLRRRRAPGRGPTAARSAARARPSPRAGSARRRATASAPRPTSASTPTRRRTIFHTKCEPWMRSRMRSPASASSGASTCTRVDFSSGSSCGERAEVVQPSKTAAARRMRSEVERVLDPPDERLQRTRSAGARSGRGSCAPRALRRAWKRCDTGSSASTWMSAGSASFSAKRSASGASVVSRSRCATWASACTPGVGAARAVELESRGGRALPRRGQDLARHRARVLLDLPAGVARARRTRSSA